MITVAKSLFEISNMAIGGNSLDVRSSPQLLSRISVCGRLWLVGEGGMKSPVASSLTALRIRGRGRVP